MTVKLRLVQRAADPAAPLLVAYLVGSQCDADMRAALPGCGIVASSESGVATTGATLAQARILAGCGDAAPLVLLGYSAGCQGVRRHLLDGVEAAAVVAIDGTHASWPPAPWQIDAWKRVADRARMGSSLFVGTCTQQLYTERLGPGKAFASTRTVLQRATGAALNAGNELHDGGLHVIAYASADIDAAAHIRQQREVMPEMLRTYVAPWFARAPGLAPLLARIGSYWAGLVSDVVGRVIEPTPEPPSLGLAALEVAKTQLGVREATGRNDGAAIAAYFDGCTRRSPNGVEARTGWATGWDWCAAFASWCGYRALGAGQTAPHGRRIAVWELVRDALEAGRFDDVSAWGSGPRPGDLVIWQRAGDPRKPGQTGHVSRCESFTGGRLVTIGGNEENRVRRADVTSDLPRAVGVIRY